METQSEYKEIPAALIQVPLYEFKNQAILLGYIGCGLKGPVDVVDSAYREYNHLMLKDLRDNFIANPKSILRMGVALANPESEEQAREVGAIIHNEIDAQSRYGHKTFYLGL